MPSFGRGREEIAVQKNRECELCHTEIAAEWRASLHKRAHDDEVYQRAFALEPLEFCTACRAPESRPDKGVPPEVGALGVGCVTCHVQGDAVVTAPLDPGRAEAPAPHVVVRDERFGSREACAGCHEFAFGSALREPARGPHHAPRAHQR